MKDFTPDEEAELQALAEKASALGTDVIKAGVPLGQPNPIPTLITMLFEEGGPFEHRRFEFEKRILESFIAELEAAAPDLKVQAARAQLQQAAALGDLKARGLTAPGPGMGGQPSGLVHNGRTTSRRG